jgi:thiol-disulfide isomerase/thioredoxin
MRSSLRSLSLAASVIVVPVIAVTAETASAQTRLILPRDTIVSIVELEPKHGELATLLAAEVKKARDAGRTPFVELGATWCGPCRAINAALAKRDTLMLDAFTGTAIIRLDIDVWKGSLEPLGLTNPGIPAFFAVDSTGKAAGPKIDGGAWGEDIPVNMAPPLKKFFRANLTSTAPKPVAVAPATTH